MNTGEGKPEGPVAVPRAVLSIAGLDPSAGAGLLADNRVFDYYGLYGMGVISALTVQNSRGVSAVMVVEPGFVRDQLEELLGDTTPIACKTGMLASAEMVRAVASFADEGRLGRLVIDPVLTSSSGRLLADTDLPDALMEYLIPSCGIVTPNLAEAGLLTGTEVDSRDSMLAAAELLLETGAGSVCVTGGHLPGDAADLFLDEHGHKFIEPGTADGNITDTGDKTHGTGCCFSAAVVAHLALGDALFEAVSSAKELTARGMEASIKPGSGMRVPWIQPPFESGHGRV